MVFNYVSLSNNNDELIIDHLLFITKKLHLSGYAKISQ